MRQKKSNAIYYIIALVILALIGFVSFTELPVEVEHIEQTVN
jgi:hypothetical protein